MSRIDTVVRGVMLSAVQTRQVGQNNNTLWEAVTPDGTKWVTFKAGLGNKASALAGQIVDIEGTIEQKEDSNFVNYYLNKIQASNGGVAEAAAKAAGAAAGATEVTYEQFAQGQRDQNAATEKAQKQKELSIHRQVATKVSAVLVSANDTPGDFWANVEDLVAFYQTGMVPTAYASGTPMTVTSHSNELPKPNPQNDQFLHTDDDIPF